MANVYIDIGYVTKACERHGFNYLHLNLEYFGGACAALCGWSFDRAYLYDATEDSEVEQRPESALRQAWLNRNNHQNNVHYRRGRVAGRPPRQKRVDVQLAVDVLRDLRNLRDPVEVILVTGDDDFTPLVEAVREYGPHVALVLFPKCGGTDDLRTAADYVKEWDFGSGHWQNSYRDAPFL